MTDFKVGDLCEITKDFTQLGWAAGTPVELVGRDMTYNGSGIRFHVRSTNGRTEICHTDHLRLVSSPNYLACPHCGDTESFYEVNTSTNCSDISWVDATTGEVHWDGHTEYGDPTTVIGYECGACNNKVEDWYFDPNKRAAHDAERIKSAQEDLDRILAS